MIDQYCEAYDLMMLEKMRAYVARRSMCSERTLQNARYARDKVGPMMAARIVDSLKHYGYLPNNAQVSQLFPRIGGTVTIQDDVAVDDMRVLKDSLSALWLKWVRSGRTGIDTIRQLENSQNPTTRVQATIALHHLESRA